MLPFLIPINQAAILANALPLEKLNLRKFQDIGRVMDFLQSRMA